MALDLNAVKVQSHADFNLKMLLVEYALGRTCSHDLNYDMDFDHGTNVDLGLWLILPCCSTRWILNMFGHSSDITTMMVLNHSLLPL